MTHWIRPREEWVEPGYPMSGPASAPERIGWIVFHYPGADIGYDRNRDGDIDPDDTRLLLQAWNRYAWNVRDYSLYYCFVIGRTGDIWQVRGLDLKNAANGPTEHPETFGANANTATVSVKFVTDLEGAVTFEQVEAGRWLVADLRRQLGRDCPVIPHSDVKSTSCPGDRIRALITAGMFEPLPPPPIASPEEMIEMIAVDYLPGQPGWVRCTWTGTHLAWVFDGQAAAVLDRAGVEAQTVTRDELKSIIRSATRTTSSPWGPGGYPPGHAQHDGELHKAWGG